MEADDEKKGNSFPPVSSSLLSPLQLPAPFSPPPLPSSLLLPPPLTPRATSQAIYESKDIRITDLNEFIRDYTMGLARIGGPLNLRTLLYMQRDVKGVSARNLSGGARPLLRWRARRL